MGVGWERGEEGSQTTTQPLQIDSKIKVGHELSVHNI